MTRRHGRRISLATLVLLATLIGPPAMAAEDRATNTTDIAVVLQAPAQALELITKLLGRLLRAESELPKDADVVESPAPPTLRLETSGPGVSSIGCEPDPWG